MRLTTKINLYIIFVCVVIIAAVKYQTDRQKEFVDLYISKLVEQKEVLFNTVIDLRSEPFKKVLEENSLWDDLVKFIKVQDSKWAKENINTMLDVHKANCVWLYNSSQKKIYSIQNLSDSTIDKLPVPDSSFLTLFKDTKVPHFFCITKEGLMEMFGATVHPTSDLERKTAPAGYFFVGKLWDKKYEESIEQIIDCSIDILLPGDKDTLSNNVSARTFTKKITDPINGKNIANIKVSKDISQLMDMERLSKKTFGGIMIFFVVFVILTAFSFWMWVAVPLNKISSALNKHDLSHINDVVNNKSVFGNIAKMIIDFFNQKKEIEESEKKFKDMFEGHSAVMLLLDPVSGSIVDANASCSKYYGYEHDILTSMNISDIDVQSKQDLKIELSKSTRGEQNYFLYRHKLANKDIRDVEVYSNPISFGDKKVLFLIIHDITERKIAQSELMEAKDSAEKASLMKAQFLSNMSHEIRTPLNAIIGLTNLMISDKEVEEKIHENLNAIKYSADHLHSIINDILDFSKIEAGKVSLEKIDFNLRELIDNVSVTLGLKAKEKGLFLKTSVDDKVPKMIVGDPVRLNQILINLIGNAVKFTESGGIKVIVETKKLESRSIDLLIKVIDTGIGISLDKIDKIFESFTQAYVDTTRKFGGTGLGLAITKKLVEMQGGKMLVTSEVGTGSEFSFDILFGISENQDIDSIKKDTHHHKNLKGIKLLLAEDNVMNQFLAKQLFSKWGIIADVANNGEEAVEMLRKNDYEILLLDLQMPKMNGFEVIEIIRDNNSGVKNHNIPVIALTADISIETKRKVSSSGMNDFVLKPFEQNELYSKIAKFIL